MGETERLIVGQMFSGFWGNLKKTAFSILRKIRYFCNILFSISYHLATCIVTSVMSL